VEAIAGWLEDARPMRAALLEPIAPLRLDTASADDDLDAHLARIEQWARVGGTGSEAIWHLAAEVLYIGSIYE